MHHNRHASRLLSRGSQPALTPFTQPSSVAAQHSVSPQNGPFALLGRRAIGAAQSALSFMDPGSVGKPLVFVSDYSSGAINIFRQTRKNKMIGRITGLLAGNLATDRAANLYVLNYTSSNVANVLVYAPPYTGAPKLTIDDTSNIGNDVAVDSSGVVAIANYCNASCTPDSGSVTFYFPGSTTPCATVTDPNFANVYFAGFDHRGDLFIDGTNSGSAIVFGRVKGRCHAKVVDVLTTGNMIRGPGRDPYRQGRPHRDR